MMKRKKIKKQKEIKLIHRHLPHIKKRCET